MTDGNGSNAMHAAQQKPEFTMASIVLIIALIVMVFSMFLPGARLTGDYQLYAQLFGGVEVASGLTAGQVAEPSAFTVMQLVMQQKDKSMLIIYLFPAVLVLACFACVLAKKPGAARILTIFAGVGTFMLSMVPISALGSQMSGMYETGVAVYVAAAAAIVAFVTSWIWQYQALKARKVS